MSDHTSTTEAAENEIVASIHAAAAKERQLRAAAEIEPTAEELAAQQVAHADILHLRALATPPKRKFPPGASDPEIGRGSRERLRWLSTLRYLLPPTYLPRTWGYTILCTTYADNDAAVDAAAHALSRFMRATGEAECEWVTEKLQELQLHRRLPESVPNTADARPSDEFYINRFVTEVVQDKDELNNATIPEACAYFRRWSLARWPKEERYFTAASPRLKSAILFDAETIAQLQGLAARGLVNDREVSEAGKEFWVKMVEAEPEQRDMEPGLSDCFRVPLGLLEDYWFERDRSHPATEMLWETDERFPGELFFTTP